MHIKWTYYMEFVTTIASVASFMFICKQSLIFVRVFLFSKSLSYVLNLAVHGLATCLLGKRNKSNEIKTFLFDK